MITANLASSVRIPDRNRDSYSSIDLEDLVEERKQLEVGIFENNLVSLKYHTHLYFLTVDTCERNRF